MKLTYIYKMTNLINGKTYVGQFTGTERNFKFYRGGGNLQRKAIKKYGKENFKKEIIIQGVFNRPLRNALEKHYIRLYSPAFTPNSYNLDPGGVGRINVEKEIFQYTISGEFVNKWKSREVATIETGIGIGSLTSAANGRSITAEGFLWMYDEKELQDKIDRYNDTTRKRSMSHSKHVVFIYQSETWHKFNGTVNAAKFLNCHASKINACVNNNKGYHWYKSTLVSNSQLDVIPELPHNRLCYVTADSDASISI